MHHPRWHVGQLYVSNVKKMPDESGPVVKPNKNNGVTLSAQQMGGRGKAWDVACALAAWPSQG